MQLFIKTALLVLFCIPALSYADNCKPQQVPRNGECVYLIRDFKIHLINNQRQYSCLLFSNNWHQIPPEYSNTYFLADSSLLTKVGGQKFVIYLQDPNKKAALAMLFGNNGQEFLNMSYDAHGAHALFTCSLNNQFPAKVPCSLDFSD